MSNENFLFLFFTLSVVVYTTISINHYSSSEWHTWTALSSVSLAFSVYALFYILREKIYYKNGTLKYWVMHKGESAKEERTLWVLLLFYLFNITLNTIVLIMLRNPMENITVMNNRLTGKYQTVVEIWTYLTLVVGVLLIFWTSMRKFTSPLIMKIKVAI